MSSAVGASAPRGLDHLARAKAPGAHPDVLRLSVDRRSYSLQIRQPAPFGDVVGVGDIAPGHRSLAADFTSLRHDLVLQRSAKARWD